MFARLSTAAVITVLGFAHLEAQPLSSRAANPADVGTLDGIVAAFYEIVSGPAGEARNWSRDSTLYIASVRFTFDVGSGAQRRWQTVDHATYARQAGPFLERGFHEREIHRVVHQFGGLAHVFSTYEWSSPSPTGPGHGRGINSIELVFEAERWWITFVQWTGETADRPIPAEYLPRSVR